MRRVTFDAVLAPFGCLLFAAILNAGEGRQQPADEVADKAAALVRQLGSDSFEVREAAYRELAKLGKAALKALEEGAESKDSEISGRSKRLLALANRTELEIALDAFLADKDTKLLLKLPAWERFKKVFGEEANASALFVDMYATEGKLLASLEREPQGFETVLNARCLQIQRTLAKQSGEDNSMSMGQVVALLFMATDSRVATSPRRVEPWHHTLTDLLYRPNIQRGFRANAGARKLLAQYFEQRADHPNYMLDAVNIALCLDLKEMAPIILKGATNKHAGDGVRASAIIALGKLGTKDNLKDLEPFLNDTTRLQYTQSTQQGATVKYTEMRDIALAAMIMMSGEDILEYDFPAVKTPNFGKEQLKHLSYISWGFDNEEQRQAALKKFKGSQDKAKK